MKIKNATIRSVELPTLEKIKPLIEEQGFHPLGEKFISTSGFEKNEFTGELVTPLVGVGYAFTVREDVKSIPASAVKSAVEEKIKEIENEQKRKVGNRESREIRDAIFLEMIPKAIIKTKRVDCFYISVEKRLLIASASGSLVELVSDKILYLTGMMPRSCWDTSEDWKKKVTADLSKFVEGEKEAFGAFNAGDSVSLKSEEMGKATFNPRVLDYAYKGITEAVSNGMVVDRIELEHETLSFKIGGKELDAITQIKDFGALSDEEKSSREELDKSELWRVESATQVLTILATHAALIERYAPKKT